MSDEKPVDKIIWTYPNDNEDEYLEQLQPKLKVLKNKSENNNMGAINIDEMYKEFCGSILSAWNVSKLSQLAREG